jgi:hypothetical protein
MNLSKSNVEELYAYTDSSPYGLKLLVRMSDNSCLYFDSTRFFYGRTTDLLKKHDWKKITYDFSVSPVYVKGVRQDEVTNYFIHFSDASILHIYQLVHDLENWEQDYQIVNQRAGKEYREIHAHMNEDWIAESEILTL